MSLTIANLRDHAVFVPIAANRTWTAWWAHHGTPEAAVLQGFQDIVAQPVFPFGIVATMDGEYAGHVLAIENDLAERPDLSPWVAALWVEPSFRQQGIAKNLMDAAVGQLAAQGRRTSYLCAKPSLRGFYIARGWKLLETEVEKMDVFARSLA